jgi:hypothetical protein
MDTSKEDQRENFYKWLEQNPGVEIIGETENEHGERFVVFKHPHIDDYYVTGDEIDWVLDWKYKRGSRYLSSEFILSPLEAIAITEVIQHNSK